MPVVQDKPACQEDPKSRKSAWHEITRRSTSIQAPDKTSSRSYLRRRHGLWAAGGTLFEDR